MICLLIYKNGMWLRATVLCHEANNTEAAWNVGTYFSRKYSVFVFEVKELKDLQ